MAASPVSLVTTKSPGAIRSTTAKSAESRPVPTCTASTPALPGVLAQVLGVVGDEDDWRPCERATEIASRVTGQASASMKSVVKRAAYRPGSPK